MIIVDSALRRREAEQRPIRVGMIGSGFMAQGLANQILNSVPGMQMTAVYGRRLERAVDVYRYADLDGAVVATTQDELEDAVRAGRPVVTDDAFLLARSEQIDALVDVTGSVEFGARVALEAFRHGKHVILMNAELDATIGPILHVHAGRHGVIHLCLRRRRTRPADESGSLGSRARVGAAGHWKREGPAGSLPQPRYPEGLR